jgi:hypothetical protein
MSTGPHNPPQRSTPYMCMPYRMWGGCSQNALRARERFGRVGRAAGVLKPCRSQARSCVLCALYVFEWVTRGTGPHNPPQRSTPYMCAIPYVGWTFTERLASARWTGRLPSQQRALDGKAPVPVGCGATPKHQVNRSPSSVAYGHMTPNTPRPIRTVKLSGVQPV